ncbi:hypothetical protein [Streptomyces griseus]|uniref:hypothetical protein n=1 Tax=Streptomyces griseus TaxID=1911 RepID=UPI0033C7CEA5
MPHVSGTKHHAAKLNNAKVRQARKSFATGKWSIARLAEKYGVSRPAMSAAVHGHTWKHVT